MEPGLGRRSSSWQACTGVWIIAGIFLRHLLQLLHLLLRALGCSKLHIMAGRRIEGVSREQAVDTFRRNLEAALPLLEKARVR